METVLTSLVPTCVAVILDFLGMELTVQVCLIASNICNKTYLEGHNNYIYSLYTDNDECVEGTDLCDSYADCTNTIGSHNCTCIVGYSGNGYTCGKHTMIDLKCHI